MTRFFFALVLLVVAGSGSNADAQTVLRAQGDLRTLLNPGMTVWITDSTGREDRMRIVDVSDETITTATTAGTRSVRTSDVMRVRTRQSDSLLNGALIGAGAGVASGLFLCRLTEPWEVCRGNVGAMFRIGALGAGIGIAVDALIRGRKTIYEANPPRP